MRVRCGQHGLYGARSRNGEVGLRQELGNGKQRVHRRAFDDVRVSCTPSRARTRSGSGNGAAMGRRVTSRSGLVGRGPAAKACVRGPRPIIVVAGLALSAQYGMRTGRRGLRIGPRPRECWAGSTANPPAAQATVSHSADNNVVQKHSAVPSVGQQEIGTAPSLRPVHTRVDAAGVRGFICSPRSARFVCFVRFVGRSTDLAFGGPQTGRLRGHQPLLHGS